MSETAQMGLFDRPAPAMHGVDEDDPNVAFVVNLLAGRKWITAAEILKEIGRPVNEGNKRWVRAMAEASRGRIAGGQHGYRLVKEMTAEEYGHWRNWMNHQSEVMKRRVIEGDKVFYGRTSVEPGVM
jgi:hypothetical protein